jgi:hypothetical protein
MSGERTQKHWMGCDIYDYHNSLSLLTSFVYLYWYYTNVPHPSKFLSNSAYEIAEFISCILISNNNNIK